MIRTKYLLSVLCLFILISFYGQEVNPIRIEVFPDGQVPGQQQDSLYYWILNNLHGGGGVIDTATITYTGNFQAFGRFWGGQDLSSYCDQTNPGCIDEGLILSTGKVEKAGNVEPANGKESDVFQSPPINFNGDDDLRNMYEDLGASPFDSKGDEAVIEFEYTPYGDMINLRYIFASEEYPNELDREDVDLTDGSQLYDIFGVFIDIAGSSGKRANRAILPPLIAPDPPDNWVTLNTVNAGSGTASMFFTSNEFTFPDYFPIGFGFDAMTKPMDAILVKTEVQACKKYNVKIAIEDFIYPQGSPEGQFAINSALFLAKGSFFGGADKPPWTVEYEYTNPAFEGKLVEGGCNELLVTFTLAFESFLPGDYYIPFQILLENYRDKIHIVNETTGDVITNDTLFFPDDVLEQTLRISTVNLDADVSNIKFNYSIDPCDNPPPFINPRVYKGNIPFDLVNNEPFSFTENPKVYEAYCKETIDLTITDITSGGVDPITFVWPDNPIPPVDVYSHTVNNSPDYVQVIVMDKCDNEDTVLIRIDNKPIVLDQIQQIFLCGPGQSATVPVDVIVPDQPGYSIEHVKWWKQGNPNPPLGDEDDDEITVVYDNVVGDDVWTCLYEVVDVCGGEADASFEVNQSSLVLNDEGICSGDEVVLFTGTPAHWYEWYREEPGGTLTLIGNSQSTTDNSYPPGENEIRYLLKIEDNCGELQEAWMTVFIDIYEPAITLSPGNEICYGATITLEATAGATEYLWSNGETTRTITLDVNDYQLGNNLFTVETVSSSDYFYCINSADTEFTVYANPESAFAIDPADHPCTNTDISFDYLGNEQSRTFLWDFGDGSPNNSNAHTIHQYTNAGTYYVNLFVEHTYPSGYRCSSDSTATVIVDPLPVAAFSPSPIEGCEPLDVTFTDNSVDVFPNATYDWSFGDGNTYSGLPGGVNHTYDSAGSYTVGLTVTNTDRCFGSNSYQYIKVNPNPDADFIADPWVTTMDAPEIKFFNESNSDDLLDLFEWDFDDNNNSLDENPTHTYIEPGLYSVYFRIETEKGCWDTIVKQVELSLYVKMYIPNAFSPNGDGLNDKFEIKGTPITDYNLYIFDRWGKQIWSTHNWEEQWDGSDRSGNKVPMGTYIYKIAGTSPDPDLNYELGTISYQGTVTVTK